MMLHLDSKGMLSRALPAGCRVVHPVRLQIGLQSGALAVSAVDVKFSVLPKVWDEDGCASLPCQRSESCLGVVRDAGSKSQSRVERFAINPSTR